MTHPLAATVAALLVGRLLVAAGLLVLAALVARRR